MKGSRCFLRAFLNSPPPQRQPENMENGASEAKDPSGFLSEIIGAPVTVKLNSGVVYKGRNCPTAPSLLLQSFLCRLLLVVYELTRKISGAL